MLFELVAIVSSIGLGYWSHRRRIGQSKNWPAAEGYVEQIEESRDQYGFLTVTLAYTYKIEGERYAGRESFDFYRDAEAARFEAAYRERRLLVHYRPGDPGVSVIARDADGKALQLL